MQPHQQPEKHRIKHVGWLRAAVLGANDGIISISSLLIGIAAANTPYSSIFIAGIAGWIAGAMSMAAGEYISVSSQADTEKSELAREQYELENFLPAEIEELKIIYVNRGLEPTLAHEVALQLMAKDALGAHARDELGITETLSARPLQAAFSSAASFTLGSILPILTILIAPKKYIVISILISTILFLALLGTFAAKIGGSKVKIGATRVVLWGAIAMLVSAGIGKVLGVNIS